MKPSWLRDEWRVHDKEKPRMLINPVVVIVLLLFYKIYLLQWVHEKYCSLVPHSFLAWWSTGGQISVAAELMRFPTSDVRLQEASVSSAQLYRACLPCLLAFLLLYMDWMTEEKKPSLIFIHYSSDFNNTADDHEKGKKKQKKRYLPAQCRVVFCSIIVIFEGLLWLGAFKNYVDQFLPYFDHLPTSSWHIY